MFILMSNLASLSGASWSWQKSWPPPNSAMKSFLVRDFRASIEADFIQIEFASVDDPAFFYVYASDGEIHAALSIPDASMVQGATRALSAIEFPTFAVITFAAACDMNICGGTAYRMELEIRTRHFNDFSIPRPHPSPIAKPYTPFDREL